MKNIILFVLNIILALAALVMLVIYTKRGEQSYMGGMIAVLLLTIPNSFNLYRRLKK